MSRQTRDCRGMVRGEENNQAVTNEVFKALHFVAAQRGRRGRVPH
jgi:hypothetical protein